MAILAIIKKVALKHNKTKKLYEFLNTKDDIRFGSSLLIPRKKTSDKNNKKTYLYINHFL